MCWLKNVEENSFVINIIKILNSNQLNDIKQITKNHYLVKILKFVRIIVQIIGGKTVEKKEQ